jgi:hypothetical protein
MKIAITIRDNDFWSTYCGVLTILNDVYKTNLGSRDEWDMTNKEVFKDMLMTKIDEISYGCYLLYQNGSPQESLRDYLNLRKQKMPFPALYINEEVDEMLAAGGPYGWTNGDVFILDTDLDYPNNECIYTI